MARKNTTICHSSFTDNKASSGNDIYSDEENISLNNNWWGSNNPDFQSALNYEIDDDFKWIIMSFTNTTPFKVNSSLGLNISFDKTINKNGEEEQLENPNLLPTFKTFLKVKEANGNERNYELTVKKGSLLKTISVKSNSIISANIDDEAISLNLTDSSESNESNNSNSSDSSEKSSETNVSEENNNDFNTNQRDINKNINLKNVKDNLKILNSTQSDLDSSLTDSNNSNNNQNADEWFNINYGLVIIPIALVLFFILFALKRKKDDEEDEN